MSKACRYARFRDIGFGIGRISWNDLRVDKDRRAVREVIAYDVCGEHATRLDLDSWNLEPLRVGESGPWTPEQIRDVTAACQRTRGRSFGDPFGTFDFETSYGLWNGRKPSWLGKQTWENRKEFARREVASPQPAPRCPPPREE